MTAAPQLITWDAVDDGGGGVLWRGCCGQTCAAAYTKAKAEELLMVQLNAMNQPDPGPSTIQRGDQPAHE